MILNKFFRCQALNGRNPWSSNVNRLPGERHTELGASFSQQQKHALLTQPAFICSKSTMEIPGQWVNPVQS